MGRRPYGAKAEEGRKTMARPDSDWIACAACNRGGRGNDPQKCASGWQVTEFNGLGCFLGTPIIGEHRQPPKLTRAQRNYREFMRSDSGLTFAEWMGFDKDTMDRKKRRGIHAYH